MIDEVFVWQEEECVIMYKDQLVQQYVDIGEVEISLLVYGFVQQVIQDGCLEGIEIDVVIIQGEIVILVWVIFFIELIYD